MSFTNRLQSQRTNAKEVKPVELKAAPPAVSSINISPNFIKSVREEEATTFSGKPTQTTIVTIKGEYLRDDYFKGKDEEFEANEIVEHEGQLFSYDGNHEANLSLSDEVVQKYKDELKEAIEDGTIVWWEDYIREWYFDDAEDEIKQSKEAGSYIGGEWLVRLNQLNPITKGKEDDYTISDEGLLRFYEVPKVVWEHLDGSWCDG
jgi:hypothetical protein